MGEEKNILSKLNILYFLSINKIIVFSVAVTGTAMHIPIIPKKKSNINKLIKIVTG